MPLWIISIGRKLAEWFLLPLLTDLFTGIRDAILGWWRKRQETKAIEARNKANREQQEKAETVDDRKKSQSDILRNL